MASGGHDLDRAHVVHVHAADAVGVGHARRRDPVGVVHVEDHLVAGLQLVEATEVGVVARAVAGDHHVAQLAGHRRARPVAGAVVERRQADALEERRVDIDRRDLQAPEVLLRLGVVVERGRDRDRQRHQRGGRGGGRGVGGGGGIGSRGGGRLGRQRAGGLAVLQRFGDRVLAGGLDGGAEARWAPAAWAAVPATHVPTTRASAAATFLGLVRITAQGYPGAGPRAVTARADPDPVPRGR